MVVRTYLDGGVADRLLGDGAYRRGRYEDGRWCEEDEDGEHKY